MKRSADQRRRKSSAFTLLECVVVLIVLSVSIVVTVLKVRQAREAAAREYKEGFVAGVLLAVREGDMGGIMCGDATHRMDGFNAGRFLVGCELNRTMSDQQRVESARETIQNSMLTDVELINRVFVALDETYGANSK